MVMGVTPAELARHYPRLYHMADGTSWASLQRLGLLSTDALVDLFKPPPNLRDEILSTKRTRSIPMDHPTYGRVIIRDQKPLHKSKLEGCLTDCSFDDWLRLLNSRVFFWLTEERLRVLMCAREYCAYTHVVLILNTLKLCTDYQEQITLAPMNTGNTQPWAHPRGLSTFRRMRDYPFQERLRRGEHYCVVELAVEGGVKNIVEYALEVCEMRCSTCDRKQMQELVKGRKLFP